MARKKRNTSRAGSELRATAGGENLEIPPVEQSGDLQGLPDLPQADSQSVRELVAEGQAFEAAVISGVEDAPPADAGEVKTREAPEDDVPPEYLDRAQDEPKE